MASVRSDARRLARLPGVRAAIRAVAGRIANEARAELAAHRAEGQARIEVSRGQTDVLVSLVDPAALSIEYGRQAFTNRAGRRVGPMQGLYIMTRAARRG